MSSSAATGDDDLFGDSDNTAIVDQGDDYLDGEAGNDYLRGYGGNDQLFGGDGDDELHGENGDDYLDGEDGNDVLFGGDGADRLIGGTGNDQLSAEAGTDFIQGGGGDDNLFGGDGADYLSGDEGNDQLQGGDGDDRLIGGSGDDVLLGGAGNDLLLGGQGLDALVGGDGDDVYVLSLGEGRRINGTLELIQDSGGKDVIRFGAGIKAADLVAQQTGVGAPSIVLRYSAEDEVVITGALTGAIEHYAFDDGTILSAAQLAEKINGAVTYTGGSGPDVIFGGGSDDRLSGGAGDDTVAAGAGVDIIDGGDGNDTIDAGAGNDTVTGGLGDDVMSGGAGSDSIRGGAGNDSLIGGADYDQLFGDAGDDILDAGAGGGSLEGGLGNDTYLFDKGQGPISINNADASFATDFDRVVFGAGLAPTDINVVRSQNHLFFNIAATGEQLGILNYFSQSNSKVDAFQFADGTSWDDAAVKAQSLSNATEGSDSIFGYETDDEIHGRGGNDSISGGAGNDRLFGDAGADFLSGDDGDDYLDAGTDADADQLIGGNGNDTLIDGEIMLGGFGADTFILNSWKTATITDAVDTPSNIDVLRLPTGIAPADLTVERGYNFASQQYDDLILRNKSQYFAPITVINFFLRSNADFKIDQIVFADGTVWDVPKVFSLVTTRNPRPTDAVIA